MNVDPTNGIHLITYANTVTISIFKSIFILKFSFSAIWLISRGNARPTTNK